MLLSNLKKKVSLLLFVTSVSVFTIGCGSSGGTDGSGTGGDAGTQPTVTITTENADKVTSGTVQSISGALELESGGIPYTGAVSNNIAKSASKLNKLSNIAAATLEPGTLAESGTESCSGGGSVSYNGNESTGGTVTFNQCVESGITINGTMVLTISGADTTTKLSDFSVKASYADAGSSYNVEAYYQTAIVHLNTNTYDMDLTATGYAVENADRFDFENYSMTKTGNQYTFNGLVKTDCMGGWIELKTTKALVMDNSYGCPTAGEIISIGDNSEMKFVFNTDTSVDVTVNGAAYKSYNSCDDLPENCK